MIFCARAKVYGPAGAATILIFDWGLFVSLLIYSLAVTRLPLQRGDVCYALLLYSAALSSALGIRNTVHGTRYTEYCAKYAVLYTVHCAQR